MPNEDILVRNTFHVLKLKQKAYLPFNDHVHDVDILLVDGQQARPHLIVNSVEVHAVDAEGETVDSRVELRVGPNFVQACIVHDLMP